MNRAQEQVIRDNALHSVRVDVWEQLKATEGDKVMKPHRDFATVREAFDQADRDMARMFQRYEECRTALETVGVVAQVKLSPMLDAAYREWIRAGSDEPLPRVFTEIPDPPIGPEHE